ncbi:hypothetical protein [Labrenzia sp. 011]|uniref:hypothetical protein n=1 Tax=Labrenzia sp. 011 TaxID=2171494 RepID=UPI000D522C22|nr:hypothetical protein [Labrenzia sp. 011]PVB59721.1 hypothetical protein DCO57_21005 [Labrenzia sp. 011]
MSIQYAPHVAALAARSDFQLPPAKEPQPGFFRRLRRAAVAVGLFAGATLAIAVVFFIPVLIFNLGRVESLEIAAELIPAAVFARQLVALFSGTFILALTFTCLVAGSRLCVPDSIVHPVRQSSRSDRSLHLLAVMRLIGSER